MTTVYTATIYLDNGVEPQALTIAETDHPDHIQARRWVKPQLPAAQVPAGCPDESFLYVKVMPCRVTFEDLDGIPDEVREPDWSQARYATLAAPDQVKWSQRPHQPMPGEVKIAIPLGTPPVRIAAWLVQPALPNSLTGPPGEPGSVPDWSQPVYLGCA